MAYEVTLLDTERGHFRRGMGSTPVTAVTNAFKKFLEFEVDEEKRDLLKNLDSRVTLSVFSMVSVSDEFFEDPKTLKEDVHDMMVLVRVDRSKDNMFTPVGWVRATL